MGCAYDNAVPESLFATIKRELTRTRVWRSVAELRRAVFDYVQGWYSPLPAPQLPWLSEPNPVGSHPPGHHYSGCIIDPTNLTVKAGQPHVISCESKGPSSSAGLIRATRFKLQRANLSL